MRLRAALATATVVMIGAIGGIPAGAQDSARPVGPAVVNLGHLDFLHDAVTYPAIPPAGHSTTEPGTAIDSWWVYANYGAGTGTYARTGGGSYQSSTNTYGQGAFDTDDVTRAAVAYLTHYRYYHDQHSLQLARGARRAALCDVHADHDRPQRRQLRALDATRGRAQPGAHARRFAEPP
jgi:hypothetical protein